MHDIWVDSRAAVRLIENQRTDRFLFAFSNLSICKLVTLSKPDVEPLGTQNIISIASILGVQVYAWRSFQ